MAASAWTIFDAGKNFIGVGSMALSANTFRMSLHKSAASTNLSGAITLFTSIGNEVGAGGGYSALALSGVTWAAGTSAGVQKWDCTDPVFTASASDTTNVRYAVIRKSVSATGGHPLCFAALSTVAFTVSTGNTLTIQMATTGVFTLT